MATREQEELRLLYQVSVADLAFFKNQQWSIAYYSLLIYGALVGLATQLVKKNECFFWALLLAISLTAIIGSVVLTKLQYSIDVRKERLETVRSKFSTAFKNAWATKEKEAEYRLIQLVLLFFVVGSAVLSAWAVVLLKTAT